MYHFQSTLAKRTNRVCGPSILEKIQSVCIRNALFQYVLYVAKKLSGKCEHFVNMTF